MFAWEIFKLTFEQVISTYVLVYDGPVKQKTWNSSKEERKMYI